MEYNLEQNNHLRPILKLLLVVYFLLTSVKSLAHEIPDSIHVRLLIHEDGEALHLLARLPLEAMRDFDFPVRGPGYLNFSESLPLIRDAVNLWLLDEINLVQGNDHLSPKRGEQVRISLPSNRTFNTFDEALVHFQSPPLADDQDLFWRQAYVDVHVTYPLVSDNPVFTIEANVSGLAHKTTSNLKFTTRDGMLHQYEITGDTGSLMLNPGPATVGSWFVKKGFSHLTGSIEYLLFLVLLAAPITTLRSLVYLVLAFALGHSLTLSLATVGIVPGYLWLSTFVDMLIALTILLLAVDNVLIRDKRRRWVMGLLFGLVHGIAFSFALSHSLQYSGNHLLAALLGFNLGVGIAQTLMLSVVVIVFTFLRRFMRSERWLQGLVSLLAGHTGLHWIHTHWLTLTAYIHTTSD